MHQGRIIKICHVHSFLGRNDAELENLCVFNVCFMILKLYMFFLFSQHTSISICSNVFVDIILLKQYIPMFLLISFCIFWSYFLYPVFPFTSKAQLDRPLPHGCRGCRRGQPHRSRGGHRHVESISNLIQHSQGSSNYLFWGGSNLMQMLHGDFEGSNP